MSAAGGPRRIPDGQYTTVVYGLIKDGKYDEAVKILNPLLQQYPKSRAALSLLAYCYYFAQDYQNSAL